MAERTLQLELLSPPRKEQEQTARPQTFTADRKSGAVVRIIERPKKIRRHSVIGTLPNGDHLSDLASHAEKLLLQRTRRTARPRGKAVRVVDMFSGGGGMSLGVREACDALGYRFEPAGVFDIDKWALAVYAKNFGLEEIQPTNLAESLRPDLLEEPTELERGLAHSLGRVDFLLAGPPCQGHSNLNNATRRKDPRNELYFRVARLAQLVKPRFILIENVLTVRNDHGQVVPRTKRALRELGYKVSETVVDLWRIGVPQKRRRHIIFAFQPKPRSRLLTLRSADTILSRYKCDPRSLRWAIGDLASQSSSSVINLPSKAIEITQRRINYLFENDLYELPNSERPDCHRLKEHTYVSVYGRLHWDVPAPTITGGFDTMGRGRFVHPEQRRTLTPHEAARIQGFPDYFDFSPAEKRRSLLAEIIGNAVPPKLSYVFALEALR